MGIRRNIQASISIQVQGVHLYMSEGKFAHIETKIGYTTNEEAVAVIEKVVDDLSLALEELKKEASQYGNT